MNDTVWSATLDTLSAQVDLQERCVRLGHVAPPDLDFDPPTVPLEGTDRLRAIDLFERCEILGLDAARGLARSRPHVASPYVAGRTR